MRWQGVNVKHVLTLGLVAEIGLVALAGVRIRLTRKHTPVVAGQTLQCKAKTADAAAQIDELHFDCHSLS